MSNIFLWADQHFGHENILTFKDAGGKPLRPFSSKEEMEETLIENHNKVVRPKDKVYWLGDVVINRKALPILSRLNGEKVLIRGNHDVFRLNEYTPYFKDVRGTHKLDKFILSHIPIHPESIPKWCPANIHGHLHSNQVMLNCGEDFSGNTVYVEDKRYICVSVEQINYTPIAFEELKRVK